jgi:uncharacterized membrane protein YhaH (DUF805 family)
MTELFSFKGKIDKETFAHFVPVLLLISLLGVLLLPLYQYDPIRDVSGGNSLSTFIFIIFLFIDLTFGISAISIITRRLRDAGLNTSLWALIFLPGVNIILLFFLTTLKSNEVENFINDDIKFKSYNSGDIPMLFGGFYIFSLILLSILASIFSLFI